MKDATQRFSDRVEDYIKYRPEYPKKIINYLEEKTGFTKDRIVADIGSGTGILSVLFLEHGNQVYCVEPNKAMREAGERHLSKYPNFKSVDGTAEISNLEDQSADLITAGQAFHWFDPDKTKKEFGRILKDGGYVMLIWNDRKTGTNVFAKDYEKLVTDFGSDYKQVDHKNITEEILSRFYKNYEKKIIPNFQDLDLAGLAGRLSSSSYLPGRDHPGFNEMMRRAEEIFDKSESNGTVRIEYDTQLFLGKI